MYRLFAAFLLCFVALAFAREARADVLEAPVNGRAIPLSAGLMACGVATGGWSVEPGGRSLRPPQGAAAANVVGSQVELKVGKSAQDCAASTATVKLVALGAFPSLDMGSFVLSLDDGRLEGRGRGLRGTLVSFPNGSAGAASNASAGPVGVATDTCGDPKVDGASEICVWAVPKTISADPSASVLRWLPAGALAAPDATIFGADGKPVPASSLAISPARVELTQLLPKDGSVDVSTGVGVLPLSHPEAVAGLDCSPMRCDIANGNLTVQAPPANVSAIDVKIRLIAHALYTRKTTPESQPSLHVAILRCPMTVASGAVPRGIDGARAVLKLEGACARDVNSLRFVFAGRRVDVVKTQSEGAAAFVVLSLGNVDGDSVSITAVRVEGAAGSGAGAASSSAASGPASESRSSVDGATVAVARSDTMRIPVIRTVLELPGHPAIDFVPNNRPAVVHVQKLPGGVLTLESLEGVYEANTEHGVTSVEGDVNAAGYITFKFGYRVPTLPAPLDKLDIVVVNDTLQRAVKEANLPAPFGVSAMNDKDPLLEVLCLDGDDQPVKIMPGKAVHVPFAQRDSCRLVIHRERLSPAYGTQKLQLEIDVAKIDGSTRSEGHVSQSIILKAGSEPRLAWLHGVVSAYDRVNVRLSHVADEAHYLGALDIATGAPMVQWSVIFGTGRLRLYATTAIPTGLYRFGDSHSSGALALNFGVISRLTWLDSEGHEGLVGVEAGVMAFGLTGDVTASGNTLTQVGGVIGFGLSIPIANAGQATQASINLHAWFEQRLTDGGGDGHDSPQAIIFGPSISVGNVGTTF